jgi:hypothetical protein
MQKMWVLEDKTVKCKCQDILTYLTLETKIRKKQILLQFLEKI